MGIDVSLERGVCERHKREKPTSCKLAGLFYDTFPVTITASRESVPFIELQLDVPASLRLLTHVSFASASCHGILPKHLAFAVIRFL
jgi:hypothetical protein